MNFALRATTFALLTAVFASPAVAQTQAGAITVFVAKKIITMDPGWPEGTAVAVRDGKILSVGSLDDLQPWLKSAPSRIDRTFADKTLMPGFIEPHGHPINGSLPMTLPLLTAFPVDNPYGAAFPGVKTQAEAFAKLAEYVAQAKSPDEAVVAWGYDPIALNTGHLDKTILDTISKTQPIVVWDASEHFAYANSAALKKYGFTKNDTKTEGVVAGKDGEPNGQFLGANGVRVIMPKALASRLQPDIAFKNVRWLMDLSRQNGITTTSDLVYGSLDIPLEDSINNRYFNDTASPMRVVQIVDTTKMTELKGDQAVAFAQSLFKRNNDRIMLTGAKFFADDAFLALSMVLANPGYIDGREGIWLTQPDKMATDWLPWWKAGFQFHVHANGSGGNQAAIDALAEMLKLYPRFDHRFTIEHYGISTPAMARQLKALGGAVSANPFFLYSRAELSAPFIGTDRAATIVRLKTLVDAGVPTALHSDAPVGSPKPLEEVWIAVNRFGPSGKVLGPEERVTVDQALRMVTIDAAFVLGVDKKLGSIEAGKFADFVVLEDDPYNVPKEKIREIKVWGTVSAGNVFPVSEIRQ
jgi:predicted amidohydrolase YtcJ